jgi:hypothetical protein
MRKFSYTAQVVANNGATVTLLVGASSALAALHNVRRQRRGDWLSIAVGTGEGDSFRALQECSR